MAILVTITVTQLNLFLVKELTDSKDFTIFRHAGFRNSES